GFRTTCYYYRKAYYRAFFLDPVACAVGEPRHGYKGETRFPFILQNVHRFFMYAAVIFIFILAYDVFLATRWPVSGGPERHFGIGVGTLVMALNVILLASYTFGCHSLRHLIGGSVDCFSCARGGARQRDGRRQLARAFPRHDARRQDAQQLAHGADPRPGSPRPHPRARGVGRAVRPYARRAHQPATLRRPHL